MVELNVFDFDTFERLGIVDEYQQAEFTTNYRKHSELDLIVDATEQNIEWFIKNNDDIFLTVGEGFVRGYIIETVKYADESKTTIDIYCKSLSAMLSWRQIIGQQTYRGNAEFVIRSFVDANAINPSNANRKIPNLVLGNLSNVGGDIEESYANKDLDEAMWEICVKQDIAYEIYADIPNKRFVFVVWQGTDRTTEQTDRDAVIFAKEFDNILTQNYTDDKSDYKNVAFVVGESDDAGNQKQLIVNDEIKGRQRREMFVDASGIKSKNEDETVMSPTEYEALLIEQANTEIAENHRVQSFETDVDYNTQFVYKKHYFMGDKVTIRNDEIGIAMHTRVVTAKEKYDKKGYELGTEFGSNVPTLLSKIKKAVK